MKRDIDRLKLNLTLYKKLYLIRKAEERICLEYPKDEIKSPVHLCIGEEAIAVGVCQALGRKALIFGTYRCHGIYLARTQETDKFFAELYGKKTGLLKGRAGSMHLCAPEHGLICTSAIVGSVIPVAVGASFANKKTRNGKLSAVFFGDGALDEGVFWESLNIASLMRLPILFILEDNGLAVFTPRALRQGYRCITDIVSQFNCGVLSAVTTDVEEVYRLAQKSLVLMRKTQQPCFLHLKYYRYKEHVGVGEDFHSGYRSKKEFERWYRVDPINLQRKKLLKMGLDKVTLRKAELAIERRIEKSVDAARRALYPQKKEFC